MSLAFYFLTKLGICREINHIASVPGFDFLYNAPSWQQRTFTLHNLIVLVSLTTDQPCWELQLPTFYSLLSHPAPFLCLDLFQRCMSCTCHLPCSAKPTLEITASANTRHTHHRKASHCECQVLTRGKEVSVSSTRICNALFRFSWFQQ